jgi:hypothetical protein
MVSSGMQLARSHWTANGGGYGGLLMNEKPQGKPVGQAKVTFELDGETHEVPAEELTPEQILAKGKLKPDEYTLYEVSGTNQLPHTDLTAKLRVKGVRYVALRRGPVPVSNCVSGR